MLRLGTQAQQAREMDLDDIFLFRLKLLLYMAADCLEGCEFSDLRRQIMLDNACHIESESIELGCLGKDHRPDLYAKSGALSDQFFYRCVNELAVLIKSIATGSIMEERLKVALQKKMEAIKRRG